MVSQQGTPAPTHAGTKSGFLRGKDELVISGIAGCYPESNNVYEFKNNLFNKVDMVTEDERRWKKEIPEIPQRSGKLPEINKFDNSYFGVLSQQTECMDPMSRILMECTYEAIVDAGVNPESLRGKRVGIFIGCCFSELERVRLLENLGPHGLSIKGSLRGLIPSRIAHWLGTKGPTYVVDTACSSSMYALEHAYKAIHDGICDSAIVGGSNLCLHPYISFQFQKLGVLSPDGKCKVFDRDANGYARSETICAAFIQKASEAKRIYSTIVHIRTNCDGYKDEGITYPSGKMQQKLLDEFYQELGLDPTLVDYVEAHGTGTKVGDPEELMALQNVFLKDRKKPLLLGSVKSNVGHTEPSAGLVSVTKAIIIMESGFIPPNINLENLRSDVEGLVKGKFKIVTEEHPFTGNLIAVNSFGFGGANAHLLLKRNENQKINGGAPADSLPRLVLASGRTEEAVDVILKDFESRPVDTEYVHLVNDLHSQDIPGHHYRGFTLLTEDSRKTRSIMYTPKRNNPVWFVFSGIGSEWPGMGKELLKIPVFATVIQKCQSALQPHKIDLINILTTTDHKIFTNVTNCFIANIACQIGLVDILKAVDIKPDGIIGHSIGELVCGYMDGCLTAEQAVLSAYYIALASIEAKTTDGMMITVSFGADKAKPLCPPGIEIACHDGHDLCTLAGPEEQIRKFSKILHDLGVFFKTVNSAKFAFHSKYSASAGPSITKNLKKVIPNSKSRSSCWISSSVPENASANRCSAEYFTNNLLNPVLFNEASRNIPKNAIIIDVSPNGLLRAILSYTHPAVIGLSQFGASSSIDHLFVSVGSLFELGLQPHMANLYPPVQFPVSRGTPMISPLVRWEHSRDWDIGNSKKAMNPSQASEQAVEINPKTESMEYLSGHVIDGRNLFPAMGYVVLMWDAIAYHRSQALHGFSIVFEKLRFMRATTIPKKGNITFALSFHERSGFFEIMESGAVIVTGRVRKPENVNEETFELEAPEEENNETIKYSTKDIYKEFRLRGYNYQGLFSKLISANSTGSIGMVAWNNNWVTFMDNLLQLKILQEDTRSLFVPTYIEKVTINVEKHAAILKALSTEKEYQEVPVYSYRCLQVIQSGGVEIRGLKANAIGRRKVLAEPVVEKHIFVPIEEPEGLDLPSSLRVCMHIAMENKQGINVKTVEVLDRDIQPVSGELALILGDLPLIQADITLLVTPQLEPLAPADPVGYKTENQRLATQENCLLVIVSDILNNENLLQDAVKALSEGACILAREKISTKNTVHSKFGLEIIFEKTLENEKLFLLKKGAEPKEPVVIHLNSKDYKWLPQVKEAVASGSKSPVFLVSQGEPFNGILGLVNCIRMEPGGENVRCVFIPDKSAPKFEISLAFYKNQLNKNISVNIYKDGKWGNYRHLLFNKPAAIPAPHIYCNILTRGDLSTLTWIEGHLDPERYTPGHLEELVQIHYSALNFRDVMVATGKLSLEAVCTNRLMKESIIGLEFSGIDSKGRRVMGIQSNNCLANMIVADSNLLWEVPEQWALEEAATIPCVYGTVLYALLIGGHMQKGDSVLIHSGTGGIGQAAINVSLHMGCKVFTTVGTAEKREFIKKQFPQLTDRNIGNSRDTSFEQLIKVETNGRGVDIVLNSLAEEKLQASVRCLAPGGRFLEIGKFDLDNNNFLSAEMFTKGQSFHGIMLDKYFAKSLENRIQLSKLLSDGIKSGAVNPLKRTVFPHTEVEQAFRYMAAGKHIGKVLVKIQSEEKKNKPTTPKLMLGKPRYYCNAESSYIITGGLGGFGLELADWLVLRGARKLVLTSRVGVKNGYQSSRIKVWKSYGVNVHVSVDDITTEKGVKDLLTKASKLGPVDAIFNLAVVLRDALLENQTEADYIASAGPKAIATNHFDVLSRKMCPSLRHFVIFSSVSCGRGNAGQTNYGMNNSVMERICEARVRDGLPGLAVQWGAIGDVGLVADMQEQNNEIIIGGTLPQKIASCLEELDDFMSQPYPVVASMVVAEKQVGSSSGDMVECVSSILGIRDLKSVSLHSTLAELGMDSMMAVEIKQTLEREFEVFLTPQEIRNLTFTRLRELAEGKEEPGDEPEEETKESTPVTLKFEGELLIRIIGDEHDATETVFRLPSATGSGKVIQDISKAGPILFMIPGVEGMASVLAPLAKNLNYQTLCLQFGYSNIGNTVQEMAKNLLSHIHRNLTAGASFNLLGFSFGGMIALEMAMLLEEEGWEGKLYLIDSSPEHLKSLSVAVVGEDEERFDIHLLCAVLHILAPKQATPQVINKLIQDTTPMKDFEERLDHFLKLLPVQTYSLEMQKAFSMSTYIRMKAISNYEWLHTKKIKSKTILVRPPVVSANTDEDYGLSKLCERKVDVHLVNGNHITVLENMDAAAIINKFD